jgi:hypothetical protein
MFLSQTGLGPLVADDIRQERLARADRERAARLAPPATLRKAPLRIDRSRSPLRVLLTVLGIAQQITPS